MKTTVANGSASPTQQDGRLPCRKISRFTLIELLVVVAIIAILAALLLPALRKARVHAYSVTARSNQRQILTATAMFEGDFGHLPYPSNGVTEGLEWPNPAESRFANAWSGNSVGVTGPMNTNGRWRIYADELVDAELITVDLFSDPGLPQRIKHQSDWTMAAHEEGAAYVYGKAAWSYRVNLFFWHSSLRDGVGYGTPLWRLLNTTSPTEAQKQSIYNHLRTGIIPQPSRSMWIGDQAFTDADLGCRPTWDAAHRPDGAKVMGFFDGHVEMAPRKQWYSTTFWGGYNPDLEADAFRPHLWDARNEDPAGGGYTRMDSANY